MRVVVFTPDYESNLPEAPMIIAYEGYMEDTGRTEEMLDEVFAFLNRDDRPNRKIRPSLSVGDIITFIGGPSRRMESWEVGRGAGYKRVTTKLGSFHDRLRYLHEQRMSGVEYVVQIPRRVS